MNLFEEAVIYATVMHAGKTRKNTNIPYILHPLEVAQIISTMTDDIEIIAAGVLHDVVEDTDGTLSEIRSRFGDRVAKLVDSETENKYEGLDKTATWKKRKEETLFKLKNADDIGIKMLWLGDKLSNIRSISQGYSEKGAAVWDAFNQKDSSMHRWYYKTVAESIELDLNRTGAFKELLKHINNLWPGTFASEKSKYKKYRQLSIDGLKMIGKGAKGNVYRYDDELIVKVYNEHNMFKDIERENYLARKAFVAGIPTAISFGIVEVGERYGSLFELLDSDSVSNLIAKNPSNIEYYAKVMADLALNIHATDANDIDLPDFMVEVHNWINGGVAYVDEALTNKITQMVDALPKVNTMIHGDFHTGNVMAHKDEFLLIDMDRLSVCHPIVELSGIYMFYVGFGELDPDFVESFMGFSYKTSKEFYRHFLINYLKTEDENILLEVKNKSALLAYVRLVRRCYKKGINLSLDDKKARDYYLDKINNLLERVDSFEFREVIN